MQQYASGYLEYIVAGIPRDFVLCAARDTYFEASIQDMAPERVWRGLSFDVRRITRKVLTYANCSSKYPDSISIEGPGSMRLSLGYHRAHTSVPPEAIILSVCALLVVLKWVLSRHPSSSMLIGLNCWRAKVSRVNEDFSCHSLLRRLPKILGSEA